MHLGDYGAPLTSNHGVGGSNPSGCKALMSLSQLDTERLFSRGYAGAMLVQLNTRFQLTLNGLLKRVVFSQSITAVTESNIDLSQ